MFQHAQDNITTSRHSQQLTLNKRSSGSYVLGLIQYLTPVTLAYVKSRSGILDTKSLHCNFLIELEITLTQAECWNF